MDQDIYEGFDEDEEYVEYQKIQFYDDESGGYVEFFVIEKTKVNGIWYLLCTQDIEEDEETDAFLFKVTEGDAEDLSKIEDESDLVIELVEDDTEMEAVGKVFAELLGDGLNIDV